jgi:hypothetical protein
MFLSSRITAKVAAPTVNVAQFVLPPMIAWTIADTFRNGPLPSMEKPNSLGSWADQHGQGDAIHVAVADRLGEELGDEPEPRDTRQDADDTGDDRHHPGQRDRALRVAGGQRRDHAEDNGGQR